MVPPGATITSPILTLAHWPIRRLAHWQTATVSTMFTGFTLCLFPVCGLEQARNTFSLQGATPGNSLQHELIRNKVTKHAKTIQTYSKTSISVTALGVIKQTAGKCFKGNCALFGRC